ncbi:Zinc finger, HIT-type, partial [Dillenia turbinata]
MGPKICEVCKDAQSKYKCPSCLVPYCSLVCFKKHKEIPCAKPEVPEEKPIAASSLPPERPCNVNEPSEVLQKVQLESIGMNFTVSFKGCTISTFFNPMDVLYCIIWKYGGTHVCIYALNAEILFFDG